MSDDRGIAAYRGGAAPSRASLVLQAIRRKVQLKTELALETSRVEALLPSLSETELAEVRTALETDDAALDADVLALAREAHRLADEAAAARTAKALSVPLSKTASRILAHEIERRLNRGHCPDLAENAIRQTYGGAS